MQPLRCPSDRLLDRVLARRPSGPPRRRPASSSAPSDQISQSRKNAITTAVAKVSPSVVTVQTEAVNQSPQDPFDIFFGRAQPRTSAGLGTGFVVRADGVIVTNAHVVAGATKVSVMMRDGTVYPATVLGSDETNDIAVLRIDGEGPARGEARQLEQSRRSASGRSPSAIRSASISATASRVSASASSARRSGISSRRAKARRRTST